VTSTLSFTDSGLTNNTTYYYAVQALAASASSAFSAQASVKPIPPPPAPLGLTVSLSGTSAVVRWTAAQGATSYRVFRSSTRGGPYADFSGNVVTSPTLIVAGLSTGTPYYFVVSASNGVGTSPVSAEVGVLPVATSLTATSGNAKVILNWAAVPEATNYRVLRSTTSGSGYQDFAGNQPTSPTFTDSSVTNGTVYYYVVQARNATATSANSTQVIGKPVAPPAAPVGFTANAGVSSVRVRWAAVPGAATYTVYRSTQPTTGPRNDFSVN
jgi:fibronectin type 3 domain-containing protein